MATKRFTAARLVYMMPEQAVLLDRMSERHGNMSSSAFIRKMIMDEWDRWGKHLCSDEPGEPMVVERELQGV